MAAGVNCPSIWSNRSPLQPPATPKLSVILTCDSLSRNMSMVLITWRSRVICKKARRRAAQLGHKAKIDVAPPPEKTRKRLFFRLVRLQFSLCAPIVPLRDATCLPMTRLLQATEITKNNLSRPTSNRYCSISFAGGFPSCGTAVLLDCF